MIVTFRIKGILGRVALTVAVLSAVLIFTGFLLSHFVVRTMADRRVALGQEALLSAANRLPHSPRVQYRLAEAEIAEAASGQLLPQALAHAQRAVNLSPWDYRYWKTLATVQESLSDLDEAEKSLKVSSRLAPNYVEVNWALANLLLRRGKWRDSLAPFGVATTANPELFPSALDLLWQASGGNVEILETLAGKNAKLQLALMQFLNEQSLRDAAIAIYKRIDPQILASAPNTAAFISTMLSTDPKMAQALWADTVKSVTGQATEGLIWNGSFEVELLKGFNQFDWVLSPSDYARIGIDRGVAHTGGRSLKVSFVGRDTTRLDREIRQLVALESGRQYHLECYAKARNLVSSDGPQLAVVGQKGIVAVSAPVVANTDEWQKLAVEFRATEVTAYISIIRIPRLQYDEPMRATVWFDDFKLTER